MTKPMAALAAVIVLAAIAIHSSEKKNAPEFVDADSDAAYRAPEQLEAAPAASSTQSSVTGAIKRDRGAAPQGETEDAAPANSATARGRSPATLYPPSATEVRAEVARDPHSTPASIIRFAQSLAPQMETALGNEDAARALQPRLAECARRAELDSTAALCLVNSRRLANQFAVLEGEYMTLSANVRPRVKQLERVLDLATR